MIALRSYLIPPKGACMTNICCLHSKATLHIFAYLMCNIFYSVWHLSQKRLNLFLDPIWPSWPQPGSDVTIDARTFSMPQKRKTSSLQSKTGKSRHISSPSHQAVKQPTWWRGLRLDANLFWSDIFSWHRLVTSDWNPHSRTGVTDLQIPKHVLPFVKSGLECQLVTQEVGVTWVRSAAILRIHRLIDLISAQDL